MYKEITSKDSSLFSIGGYSEVYGELTEEGTIQMFKNLESDDLKDKVFIDLGSGLGRPVITAAFYFPQLRESRGVELSESRHIASIENLKKIHDERGREQHATICFIHDDMFNVPLNDCDIIYISNLCMSNRVNQRLSTKIENEVKKGTIVFSSKKLTCMKRECSIREVPSVKTSWINNSRLYMLTCN
ncbi:hypothetical protein [Heterosigma akashiwo virus 01]|uniref:Histone-lysine N-methyltransferase, H3 lysine-79 specific n=1 Tax=Heterosigma akashiwo virus 01 TaxID=97195 RepID=A0A1C9C550_HAV01|nr:hypothetical protein D1R72_gp082 [Heterosigma akashiwo virus 01]AOM63413.1 hypothetical protein [Heterosigma akashiwo virus 01]